MPFPQQLFHQAIVNHMLHHHFPDVAYIHIKSSMDVFFDLFRRIRNLPIKFFKFQNAPADPKQHLAVPSPPFILCEMGFLVNHHPQMFISFTRFHTHAPSLLVSIHTGIYYRQIAPKSALRIWFIHLSSIKNFSMALKPIINRPLMRAMAILWPQKSRLCFLK